jgi:hypothetical protein
MHFMRDFQSSENGTGLEFSRKYDAIIRRTIGLEHEGDADPAPECDPDPRCGGRLRFAGIPYSGVLRDETYLLVRSPLRKTE